MWLLLGLGSALFDAGKNILAKRSLKEDNTHPFVVAWAWVFYALPITLTIALFSIPSVLPGPFWVAALLAVGLDFVSILMFVKAIKLTDLSLSLPMLALVPLILLVTGYFISEEMPTALGIGGILLVVLGAYFLNFDSHNSNFLAPIIAIFKNRGSALMFGVALIWGVTSALHKEAIEYSNPYFYTGFSGFTLSVLYTPLAFFTDRKSFLASFQRKKFLHIAPIGLLDGISVLLQFIGQSLAFSVFVIALKRTSIMMSSVAGAVLFKEKIKERLLPITVMLIGVLAIAFSKV